MSAWKKLWRGWFSRPLPDAWDAVTLEPAEAAGPVTTARFTPEGGYAPPADYAWSAAAEAEFEERLSRLIEAS